MRFDWDPAKDAANRVEHGIGFAEAAELFTSGGDFLEIYDSAHSDEEDRTIAIGPIRGGIVYVVFTDRGEDVVRIISARAATRREADAYVRWARGQEP